MREKLPSQELHAIPGANAENRQTALSILLRQADALTTEINRLKRLRPKEAEVLADELERLIERMEKLVHESAFSMDEVDKIITENKLTSRVELSLLERQAVELKQYEAVGSPVTLGSHIYFSVKDKSGLTAVYSERGGGIRVPNLDLQQSLLVIGDNCYLRYKSGRESEVLDVYGNYNQVYDGQTPDDLSEPYEMEGNMCYNRRIDKVWQIISFPNSSVGGEVVGEFPAESIDGVSRYGDTIVLRQDDGQKQKIVFLDGTPVTGTEQYTSVGIPWVVNDKVYFIGQRFDSKAGEVYLDGPNGRIGDQFRQAFTSIGDSAPVAMGDNIFFPVIKEGSTKWMIWRYNTSNQTSDGVDLGFDTEPTIVGLKNKIAYYAHDEKGLELFTYSHDDGRSVHDSQADLQEIKLLQAYRDQYIYAGKLERGWSVFVKDQQLLDEFFEEIYEIKVTGSQAKILAKKDKQFVSLTLGPAEK